MENTLEETAEDWALRQFGGCKLGDRRRTKRAVELGAAILQAPGRSLPQQMQSPAVTKAAYRFMDTPGIEYRALMQPHWDATRSSLRSAGVALLIQDLTEMDYTGYEAGADLGPIGDGRGQGYLLSTVLGVLPEPRQVLGIAYQEPFLRQPNPEKQKLKQRAKQRRETDFWVRAVEAIGTCPEGQTWVHVGDRGSDFYPFLAACRAQGCHFLIRAYENRKMQAPDGSVQYLTQVATKGS
jgi:hypothetical protein